MHTYIYTQIYNLYTYVYKNRIGIGRAHGRSWSTETQTALEGGKGRGKVIIF